ncbi:electron transporter RnfB [Marichromatium purpuratum 984]|uniref:Ion-translocating oxidoreductase complex subunit B n=1 Tax=Marichromatium purpuratum 984 TaxID=765910 RepID=W0E308_MARPU|nr:electron transport complex subunit RsxB [Marichromatium purpuratum]AHF05215.1 electron transporter RnfB [Marichromatium purpuratum 984]
MLAAILTLTALGLALGWLLGLAAHHLKVEDDPIVEQVAALLPGSQCGQCGYPGCAPAAAAIASGEAAVTCCPPGGRALAETLAELLGVEVDLAGVDEQSPQLAHIHDELCIGCTKCLKRCPTDAIMGANNMIHVVFPEACTGCGLCAAACPTEGIEMRSERPTPQTWYWPRPEPEVATR